MPSLTHHEGNVFQLVVIVADQDVEHQPVVQAQAGNGQCSVLGYAVGQRLQAMALVVNDKVNPLRQPPPPQNY